MFKVQRDKCNCRHGIKVSGKRARKKWNCLASLEAQARDSNEEYISVSKFDKNLIYTVLPVHQTCFDRLIQLL